MINQIIDNYECKLCNKKYNDKSGLWYHNKKHHTKNEDQIAAIQAIDFVNTPGNDKLYKCRKCKKPFTKFQNRWRHEQTCEESVEIDMQKTIIQMQKEIEQLKSKPTTTTTTIINNGNVNQGPVSKFSEIGVTEKEIEYIMDQELNCIISLISLVNFNRDILENHTFCSTALNDKYISTINPITLEIEKQRKKDFFDTLLWSGINKMKLLYSKLKHKSSNSAIKYKQNIDKLCDFVLVNNKGKKTFIELINALTFNRHPEQTTRTQLKNNQIPNSNRKLLSTKNSRLEKLKSNSESANSFDDNSSEEESSFENIVVEIKIKNETYILEGINIYNKDNTGKKSDFYGTYVNGKIKKNKSIIL